MENKLSLLSIFRTVDGEANLWGAGAWSVFVRTRGCTVGCHWCDTKYSWANKGGHVTTPEKAVQMVQHIAKGVTKVTITGGEPLEQSWTALARFISLLERALFRVTIETSGTQNTTEFRKFLKNNFYHSDELGIVSFVVDYKLTSSKFKGTMDIENHFLHLERGDIVKFVIDSNADFVEAANIARKLDAHPGFSAMMYFSPSHGKVDPLRLFKWMAATDLPSMNVGLNLQMHKYIFPEDLRIEEDGGLDWTKRSLGREDYLRRTKQSDEELAK